MSEALNKYFLNVFTEERLDSIPQEEQIYRGEVGRLTNINVSREDVIRPIDRIEGTKAPGPNEIFPKVLKECKSEIRSFQKFLGSCLPPEWCLIHGGRHTLFQSIK